MALARFCELVELGWRACILLTLGWCLERSPPGRQLGVPRSVSVPGGHLRRCGSSGSTLCCCPRWSLWLMQPSVGSPADLGLLQSCLASADTLTPTRLCEPPKVWLCLPNFGGPVCTPWPQGHYVPVVQSPARYSIKLDSLSGELKKLLMKSMGSGAKVPGSDTQRCHLPAK